MKSQLKPDENLDDSLEITTNEPVRKRIPRRPMLGNPWIAGVVAILFVVVFGNLDTVRVFARGVAELGGYTIPQGLDHYLINEYTQDYVDETGTQPQGDAILQIANQVTNRLQEDHFSDRVDYEIHKITSLVNGLVEGSIRLMDGGTPPIGTDRWFWAPTRVITEVPEVNDNSISEMPAFTFIYADLHAHMMAMPGILFVVLFLFNELSLAGRDRRTYLMQFFALALGAIAVGMSKAINTWDWPTLMLLSVTGLSYSWWLAWGGNRLSRRALTNFGLRVGGFVILTIIAVYPFDAWYAISNTQLISWEGSNTRVWSYLTIHGLFLFMIVSMLFWETNRWLRTIQVKALRGRLHLFVAGVFAFSVIWIIAWMFFFRGERIMLVALPIVAWIAVLFFRPNNSRSMRFVLVLAGLSLCITMGVEFFALSADIGRQNMVFKFYIQVWLFLSIAGAVAFSWVLQHSDRWAGLIRGFWYVSAGVLIFMAALFPIMALRAKNTFRFSNDVPITLDGMAYMQYGSWSNNGVIYTLESDYQIIQWLLNEVEGSPIIMEGHSSREYDWSGRISVNTGLPSIVGWRHHQSQQRTFPAMQNLVNQRRNNVNAFYSLDDVDMAIEMLRFYNVDYMVLSDFERAVYGATGGLEKFALMVDMGVLTPVFTHGQAVVYQVNQDALDIVESVALNVDEGN